MTKAKKSPEPKEAEKIWVVVADGRRARVFRRKSTGGLELLDQMVSTRGHQIKHEQPQGETLNPGDAAFIKEVGDWLHGHAEGGAFDKFVLVAASKILPHYRDSFGEPLRARMTREVEKDIAHREDSEVCKELCDIMWF